VTGRYLTEMADVLRAAGVTVVEQDGWRTRARSSGGYSGNRPWCVMWHHTASGANATAANDAQYMSYNASDKPIANLLIARDGTVWVLAAGATNTNGKGNPQPFTRGTVPADQMNTHAIGMEIQNTGVGQTYSQPCIDAAFATSLALCAAYGLAPDDVCTHAQYAPGRKIDPATAAAVAGPWQPRSINSSGSWNLDDLRAECRRRASGPAPIPPDPTPEDFDMESFLIQHTAQGWLALVYGDGKVTGIDNGNPGPWTARFGAPLPTPEPIWNDFTAKGG